MIRFRMSALLIVLVTFTFSLYGCGRGQGPTPNSVSRNKPHVDNTDRVVAQTHGDQEKGHQTHATHDHSGWWCNEHGVPEEVCGLCDSKVAAEFQKKKDWCKEHDRPASQCFVCHPELESRFAAQFEAKYGKKPPKPVLN
jgi:hypothetical protein